ncbi:hypothetical protein PGT21_014969 [Puccinia graminis f. sp. tritici]|uniref:Uncharacterized protein n=1 Tax=Puccinia graminis f. sp. tritici TaxID=56615 RepID=A0A5B0NKU2_PUCGR|nr:hypothetical protein PGT21_014969 [Puccinia graminis f. sp. tritici]KAA1089881.1 hypothetical protein PGTUg99_026131 [Puccinia graminis f. sp. tritici]
MPAAGLGLEPANLARDSYVAFVNPPSSHLLHASLADIFYWVLVPQRTRFPRLDTFF